MTVTINPIDPHISSTTTLSSSLTVPTTSYFGNFWPKLWLQRRSHALDILRESSTVIDWIADFGCHDCLLAETLVRTSDFSSMTCVDIDHESLNQVNLTPIQSTFDQASNRARPFTLDLYHGSIVHYDQRLNGVDAITLLEVIEHLDPEPLSQLPYALFKNYRPKLVIISTPNAEFNVHFKFQNRFRDPDHRFEWTRNEFETWCLTQATEYGYTVEFSGVGLWPCCRKCTHDPCGYATQFATFKLVDLDTYPMIDKWPVSIPPPVINSDLTDDQNFYSWKHIKRIEYTVPVQPDLYNIFSLPLNPEQKNALMIAMRAMAGDLVPISRNNTTPSVVWCSPAHLWRLSEVRQTWRTPQSFMKFLDSEVATYAGIMWKKPESGDMTVLDPRQVYRVFWHGANGGKVGRLNEMESDQKSSSSSTSILSQVVKEREVELALTHTIIQDDRSDNEDEQDEQNKNNEDKDADQTKPDECRNNEIATQEEKKQDTEAGTETETETETEEIDMLEEEDDVPEVEMEWLNGEVVDVWTIDSNSINITHNGVEW